MELTPLGAGVLSEFSDAFDSLASAVQKLRLNANPYEVRIAALPSIAQLWVSPRLPKIRKAMPEVVISVTAMETPPNLQREPFDLAIFYQNMDEPYSPAVSQDSILPICSPAIAARLKTVSDLKNETFLHDTTWKNDWNTWLSVASPSQNLNKSGPEYSLYSLALEECKNGAGVLMGHELLVRPLIEAGTLAAPFETEVDLPECITFEISKAAESSLILKQVITMLEAEYAFDKSSV